MPPRKSESLRAYKLLFDENFSSDSPAKIFLEILCADGSFKLWRDEKFIVKRFTLFD